MQKVLTDEERELLAASLYIDPVRFCREVLPHWFPMMMPWVHRGMLALILKRGDFLTNYGEEVWEKEIGVWDEKGFDKIRRHFVWKDAEGKIHAIFGPNGEILANDQVIQIMPRGTSKTTLMNAAILFMVVYVLRRFIVYISETATHSETQIGNIKRELEANEILLAIYGNLAATRSDLQKWQAQEFETISGVTVVCRGRGSQVRGLNRNARRPDIILLDDVEDRESVSTEIQRKKTIDWFQADVLPARAELGSTYFFLLGTLLHNDALLPKLGTDPAWMFVKFGMIDPDGDMLWPAMMSKEKLEVRKSSYIRSGTLGAFYRELLSVSRSAEDEQFKQEYIIHSPVDPNKLVARAIVIDPAISTKSGSSVCAFGVVGISEDGIIHILEACGEVGMSPRQQMDKYFELNSLYKCTHHGVESIAFQASLIHLMKEEMFRKGKVYGPQAYFEITPITHKKEKTARIHGTLQPRYAAGYVRHQKVFPEYEACLLEWPDGQLDYADAVAMAVTLLDPFAGLAGGDEPEGSEDKPEPIEMEKFRSAP